MNIIINTSNLYVGGGVQVALSFINELNNINAKNNYHIFISKTIKDQIDQHIFSNKFKFYFIPKSPSHLVERLKTVKFLSSLERKIIPDVVFTVFGPSYWKPKAPHIMGFANGWLYNPMSIAYTKLTLFNRVRMRVFCWYQEYYLKRDANFFIVETLDAKSKLSMVSSIDVNKIAVVGNTCSSIFDDRKYIDRDFEHYISLPKKENNEFRLLYIAHNHPGKNLEVINKVCELLNDKNITFIVTIDNKSYKDIFSGNSHVVNLGPVAHESCPSIYSQCDFLFAPTLLETFSASYPEAMKMNLPILTSKYSFAKSVCQNAAIYFNPVDPLDIADKIKILIQSPNLQKTMVKKGKIVLSQMENGKTRAEKYLQLFTKVLKNQ